MLIDKRGAGNISAMSESERREMIVNELGAFAPEPEEILGVLLALGDMVGDNSRPVLPRRKTGHDAMFM